MAMLIIRSLKFNIKTFPNQNNIRVISAAHLKDSLNLNDPKEIIVKKFYEVNNWYVKLTGLDDVKRLQDKVILTQERLEKAQEERREIGKLLVDVRRRYSEIQEQLHQVKRWENVQRFLDLTKLETEMMTEEKNLTAKFEVYDKAERELFTTLSNAVRDSHEKAKAQSEYTKYWGIILSIIGTIVGAVVSTIISTRRNKQIVNGINEGVEQKFVQLTSMFNADNVNSNNFDNMVSQVRKENHDLSKIILEEMNVNVKQTKENFSLLQEISMQLRENNNLMNNVNNNGKERYLLSADSIKENDQFLDIGNFVEAQQNLLEKHQYQIRVIGLALGVLGVITLLTVVGGR